MDKKIKEKWLEALRSGKYVQGEGVLRNGDDEYCCLGVLCEVAGAECSKEPVYAGSDLLIPRYRFTYKGDSQTELLPLLLSNELGIGKDAHSTLTTMNDNQGKTFKQIADWIEENL